MKELTGTDSRSSPRHPIAVVAQRTGLSQDVLRVWERRYDAVRPERGAGGQRRYSDADIERLVLLHATTRAGRSIGQVATLTIEQLAALVDEDRAARSRPSPTVGAPLATDPAIEQALALATELDGAALDQVLRRTAAQLGVLVFLEAVAAPLLRRLGDEWHAGRITPAQEHLASASLHDIIVETMRSLSRANGAPRVLVATPAGDRHAVGAALVGAAAAAEGWSVLYLGADLPASEIADAARVASVRMVALSVVYVDDRARVLAELRELRSLLPREVTLVAGGGGAVALATELEAMSVRVESSIPGLVTELRRERSDA